jgi:NAD-dependent dihydropyrimidine dehydrogenase PreA subunit
MEAASKQLDAVFIEVDVDDSIAGDADLAAKLEEVCPVDIFATEDGRVAIVRENLDECVLCELCLDAAPDGTVRVKKLYDGTELVR